MRKLVVLFVAILSALFPLAATGCQQPVSTRTSTPMPRSTPTPAPPTLPKPSTFTSPTNTSFFDFSLFSWASSASMEQRKGKDVAAVTVSPASGPSQMVGLSLSGLPSDVGTYGFRPISGYPTFTSVLTIVTLSGAPVDTYSLRITTTSGGRTKEIPFTLTVTQSSSPVASSIAVSLSPSTVQGGTPTQVSINGTLTRADTGVALSGRTVGLKWPTGAANVNTDSGGNYFYSLTANANQTWTFLVTFSGDSSYSPSWNSADLTVPVPSFDFSLSSSASSASIEQGKGKDVATVTVSPISGPSQMVGLSLSGLPSNVGTYGFRPISGYPTFTSVLTIVSLSGAPVDTLRIIATSGGRTKVITFTLTVTQPSSPVAATVPTSISVGLSPSVVPSGTPTQISIRGRLTRLDTGAALTGRTVGLQWPTGSTNVNTDDYGDYYYSLTVNANQTWVFLVTFSGDSTYSPRASTADLIVQATHQ